MSPQVLLLLAYSFQAALLGKLAMLARYARWVSWYLIGIGLSWAPVAAYAQAPAWQTAVVLEGDSAAAFRVVATVAGPAGSFYCLGSFQGTLSLGSMRVTSTSEEEDLLVAKYDNVHHHFSWVQQVSSAGEDRAGALVVSGSALYITGSFRGDSLRIGSVTLPNAGERDLFVAKLRDDGRAGRVEWAQRAGGPGDDFGGQLAVVDSSVYVAGTFQQTATFGNQTAHTIAQYSQNCFIAKLLDRGVSSEFSWVRSAGGKAYDETTALAVSGSSIYVAGYNGSSPAAFGSLTLHNTPPRNDSARPDLFLAKLTDSGPSADFIWVQQGSGSEGDVPAALVVNGADLYLAGESASPTFRLAGNPVAWLGAVPVLATKVPKGAALVAKFRDEGLTARLVWAYRIGPPNLNRGCLARQGSMLYLAGTFEPDVPGTGLPPRPGATPPAGWWLVGLQDQGEQAQLIWRKTSGSEDLQVSALSIGFVGRQGYVAGQLTLPAHFDAHLLAGPLNQPVPFLATFTPAVPGRTSRRATLQPAHQAAADAQRP